MNKYTIKNRKTRRVNRIIIVEKKNKQLILKSRINRLKEIEFFCVLFFLYFYDRYE